MPMMTREALLEQICALPLTERLELRAALDESVDRELADSESVTMEDWPVIRERLETALLQGLDSGEPTVVNDVYWQQLRGRIEQRRQAAS